LLGHRADVEINLADFSESWFPHMKFLEANCLLHLETGDLQSASNMADTWFMMARELKKKAKRLNQRCLWDYFIVIKLL
jgi:hypothetical protein